MPGHMTTYVNLCWAIGQLLASGVLRGCLPIYLVRTDRLDEIKKSITRLSGGKMDEQINAQLAIMVHTTRLEAEVTKDATYLDCFRGADLRRTEICMVASLTDMKIDRSMVTPDGRWLYDRPGGKNAAVSTDPDPELDDPAYTNMHRFRIAPVRALTKPLLKAMARAMGQMPTLQDFT
ncbi:hypothetical protein VTI74DRAFT_11500 [Chaetomium olivicolor]